MNTLVHFKKVHADAQIPSYGSVGAAGMDFYALETVYLPARSFSHKVRTGLTLELSPGTELQIRNRSSLSTKELVKLSNQVGTIDSDFRGEIVIMLDNFGTEGYWVQKGDRIAQGILAPYLRAEFHPAEKLSETTRGEGGFGSTGK